MDATVTRFDQAPFDVPVPLLDRHSIKCAQMLVANVFLHKGCVVNVHHHESEQVSVVLSGKIKWILDEDQKEVIVEAGTFVHLPSNCPHGVVALEDTHIVDVLSPCAPMGVDSQKS